VTSYNGLVTNHNGQTDQPQRPSSAKPVLARSPSPARGDVAMSGQLPQISIIGQYIIEHVKKFQPYRSDTRYFFLYFEFPLIKI
jgi:hypothetical protein